MDAVIIGGGASGISCAIRIKQNNPEFKVTVIEHLEEPCKKLYATGNGRCNITNTAASGYNITRSFFESIGLVLRESNEGRMYPYSNQAASVVNILLNACKKLGVRIVTSANAYKAEKKGEQFNIFTSKGVFTSDILVIACGGKSQKALGSDGSGYELSKSFNHSVTELSPALVQLVSSSKYCRALKGVRTKCNLSIEVNSKILAEEYGELLFADYGLSGIVTMNLSKYVNDEKLKNNKDRCIAIIDFVPSMSEKQIEEHIKRFGGLEGILPAKLCQIISKQANDDKSKIAKYAKSWRLIITGTKGYSFSQITMGGISKSELRESNESKLCSNLYIIGELTDNQFSCGGFNLDYAFSSGVKAADNITKSNDKN